MKVMKSIWSNFSYIAVYWHNNPKLLAGLILILFLLFFWLVGSLFVDLKRAQPISGLPDQRPSFHYLLGTDSSGRDLFAVMIVGTGLTLRIGFLAGIIGLGIAVILGFISGFYGGPLDTVIKGIVDVLLTVPPLAVLVVIAAMRAEAITLNFMILIVASLSWMLPTRTIRAQVLSLRERAYISMAKLSGMNNLEIITKELMPTLIPYMAAGFVTISATAVLASIGLEALGLGPQYLPTLGMTIYWAISFSALLRGMWWWWLPPVVVIVILFVGLFLLTSGLDLIANPKLKRVR
jgi:peptide/nickel transport system permease protein